MAQEVVKDPHNTVVAVPTNESVKLINEIAHEMYMERENDFIQKQTGYTKEDIHKMMGGRENVLNQAGYTMMDIKTMQAKANAKLGGSEFLKQFGYSKTDVAIKDEKANDFLIKQTGFTKDDIDQMFYPAREINIWTLKDLEPVERMKAINYNIGDKVVVIDPGAGIKTGREGIVVGTNARENTITLELVNKKGEIEHRTINAEKIGDKVTVYEKQKIEVAVGEPVLFNKNYNESEREEKFFNSEFAKVGRISNDGIEITTGDKTIFFNNSDIEKGIHIQHRYAVTVDRLQGKSINKAIAFENRNYESTLVALSRAKDEAKVYCMDKNFFIKKAMQEETRERIERMAYKINPGIVNKVKEVVEIEKPEPYKGKGEQKLATELIQEKQKAVVEKENSRGTGKDAVKVVKTEKIDLYRHVKEVEYKKPEKGWALEMLPGVTYQKGVGLAVSNTKAKDTLQSILVKPDTFVKTERVRFGPQKGAMTRTEYKYEKGLLGKKIKGVTVHVNKDKSKVVITKWNATIDELRQPQINALRRRKGDVTVVNVARMKKDIEKLDTLWKTQRSNSASGKSNKVSG